MRYQRLLGCLGFSAIAILVSRTPVLSETATKSPLEIRLVPPAPLPPAEPATPTSAPVTGNDCGAKITTENNQSQRVELYYYRDAISMVELLGKIPLPGGCATHLPLNSFQTGQRVGRGGGNVISLYGSEEYINDAQRFITSLDLPLPGIDLQLWGVQISSDDPDKLPQTTSKVRSHISTTQGLLRGTFAAIQGLSQLALQDETKVDRNFQAIANQLGYADALDGFGRESSILEIFLVGDSLRKEERVKFYQDLYKRNFGSGNGTDQVFNPLQPYLEELKKDTNRPPFERIFRSRGLKPDCIKPDNYEQLKQKDENHELKCETWQWQKDVVKDLNGNDVSLVDITATFEKKVLLEFALNYADFLENPQDFDPEELRRTADNLNELLQQGSDLLQKDIEDLFLKPTLAMIEDEVADNKGVEFAQVGRSTISTLDGVETQISTSSTSGFQVPQSQDLGQLLARAETLQEAISNFLPTAALGDASEAAETAATGGIPTSRLLGLAVAALEQNTTPVEIQTGTSLAFTPGISRNLNAAELNIDLIITDPIVTPTAEDNVASISRIGKQELYTTVYTQALDFFDLSTFTSQATLDGGRTPFPIIGTVWNAVFGAVPVFGDLFSYSNENQNVLHESLILTNSFITPTPLSLGNLYAPANNRKFQFCKDREDLLDYLDRLEPAGKASRRDTKIISERCLKGRQ